MKPKIPLGYALTILLLACAIGWHLGVKAAGPMPAIDRTPAEPERNYTQETLRILNPPPHAPVVRYESPHEFQQRGGLSASMSYFNDTPRRRD